MPDFSFLDGGQGDDGTVRINTAGAARPRPRFVSLKRIGFATVAVVGLLVALRMAIDLPTERSTLLLESPPAPRPSRPEPPAVQRTAGYWQRFVKKADFGADWPLTADEGWVRAYIAPTKITFLTGGTGGPASDSKEWALNGTAQGFKHPVIDPIWAQHEELKGLKKDIGVLIKVGLNLQQEMRGR